MGIVFKQVQIAPNINVIPIYFFIQKVLQSVIDDAFVIVPFFVLNTSPTGYICVFDMIDNKCYFIVTYVLD